MNESNELQGAVNGDTSPPVPLDSSHPPDHPKSRDGFEKQSTSINSVGLSFRFRRFENGVSYATDLAAELRSSSQKHEATSAAVPKKSMGDAILSPLRKIYSFAGRALKIYRKLFGLKFE